MKTLISKMTFLLILVLSSCSTDEAIQSSSPTNSDIMLELADSKWSLVTCPSHTFLILNGYNECDYLDNLNFSDSKVDITHKGSTYITPHHICFVYNNKLVVSIQECTNTTWRSLFEWDIVSLNGNTMVIDVSAPNLAPSYNERFEYIRI